MVRENRVFRTEAQKVSSEDILRVLRVSSSFSYDIYGVLIFVRLDSFVKSRGDAIYIDWPVLATFL